MNGVPVKPLLARRILQERIHGGPCYPGITDNYTGRRWQRDRFALPPFTDWERVMCEKCVELDGKIAHLKALSPNVTDELTLAGMALLTKHYEDQKRELHPEQK
ncbi:hypothetical protein [Bradyrhizobium elkanii]|uniref:hypothetical protein n=1 Tax=Bradyrhizobium elkanii TaxID=29448 RepID=UPI00209E249B|nr:hypothetical protein [Bradyrhizobium elkanii]MCP1973109.1 hypothetical protein [Bradyrhizobium elkanii]MCS4105384.1 hypothetical protein [Bradyrhizobium elkanii]